MYIHEIIVKLKSPEKNLARRASWKRGEYIGIDDHGLFWTSGVPSRYKDTPSGINAQLLCDEFQKVIAAIVNFCPTLDELEANDWEII